MILRRCRRHVTGYSESWSVSTDIATRLQMHETCIPPSGKKEREKTAAPRYERQGTCQYGSGPTRIRAHVPSHPGVFLRVHRNAAAASARGIWKLRHWETQSHLPVNNPLRSSDNYPHSQLTLSPANQRRQWNELPKIRLLHHSWLDNGALE